LSDSDTENAEGTNLPDFLAELKWEIDWLFSMQADDGSVYHKLSAVHFCGFIMPADERDPRYFSPWSSAATADFVAMKAAASRHFRPYDVEYADRCLAAARMSYEFLQAHPDDHQADLSAFNTGGYGAPDWDDRLWAAAELWEATGDADVLADFEARARSAEPQRRLWRRSRDADEDDDEGNRPPVYQWQVAADWDWGNVKNLGLLAYVFSGRPGRDAELVERIRESLVDTADRIVETRDSHGYARPLGERYYWGCNGTVARQVVVLEAARRVEDKPEYRTASLDALNFLFGRNVHGRSYVTGLGHQPPMHPHDRRSQADKNADPWPGYLVGGPHPTAKDWNDHQDDYRTNEIAINWNGALIYALAAVLEEDAGE
jgi:endoglucanase